MELISATHQPERNKPTYILDAMIQPRKHEKLSPKFISIRSFVGDNCPDWILFEKAKEHELTIITSDKGLILRALMENQDIVYQDECGNRFYVRGKLTKQIEKGIRTIWSKVNKQKRPTIIFNYLPFL